MDRLANANQLTYKLDMQFRPPMHRVITTIVCITLLAAGANVRGNSPPPELSVEAAAAAYRAGDYQPAFAAFLAHASNGSSRAATIVGVMYAWGEGVRQDRALAAYWYEQGAQRADPIAQFYLGSVLVDGDGIEKNTALGRRWLQRAASNGHPPAQQRLDALALDDRPRPLTDRPADLLATLNLEYLEGDERSRLANLTQSRAPRPVDVADKMKSAGPATAERGVMTTNDTHEVVRATSSAQTRSAQTRSAQTPSARTPSAQTQGAPRPISREALTANSANPATPSPNTSKPQTPTARPVRSSTSQPKKLPSGYLVQLLAGRDAQVVQAKWRALLARAPQAFTVLTPRFEISENTVWHRLRVGYFPTYADAQRLCRTLIANATLKECWAVRGSAH